jgi:hypothetical protein
VFRPYATNVYTTNTLSTYSNLYIPANTNPKFTGGTFNGVIYIEKPNIVEFAGNPTINGVIVMDSASTAGTLATNQINFTGASMTANGVESLPASYGDLRKLTGSFILAPGGAVDFRGNFNTVNGSIVSDQLSMTGNAGGTVKGTVINLQDNPLTLNGSSEIIIASTGTTNFPTGLHFGSHYVPLADTYEESAQ